MTATITVNERDKHLEVKLCRELTIYSAAVLKEPLLALLEKSPVILVNLSEVDDIDTAGFQLLIMLKKEAMALGREVTFIEHSVAVIEVMERLEMVSFFGDPVILTN